MQHEIAREELDEWRVHPVTETFLDVLKEEIDSLKQELSDGGAFSGTPSETAMAYARRVGEIEGRSAVFHILEDANESDR